MTDFSSVTIEHSRRRTMAIAVLPDATILVKVPTMVPKFMIDRFLHKHEDWIEKQLARIKARPVIKPKKYAHGEEFLYLGKPHVLDIGPHKEIIVKNSKLLFPRALFFRIEKEIPIWYQKEARRVISEQVKIHSAEMGVVVSSISFSDTKSKWGSCTHDDKLQFNWRLIMAPFVVLNYVVVHELVHTLEKNHSRAFWTKVEARNPSFRQQRLWLKKYGDTLVL